MLMINYINKRCAMKKAISLMLSIIFFSSISYAGDILPVGVYLSTTGPIAAWGRLEWEGIKVANSMEPYARGELVKLILEDAASRPEKAALSAENLVDKRIKFVIGPVTTTNALAALPIFERNGVVDVIPTANGMGLVKNRRYASRICLTNDVQAKVMARYIASRKKYRKCVIIEDISQNYSIDLAKRFIDDFSSYGGKILSVYKIHSSQEDFSAISTRIKLIKPDFIYYAAYYNTLALFVRELRSLGCRTKVFAGSAASSAALVKIAKKAAEGIVFTDDFDPLMPQNARAKLFIKLFDKRFHRLPDSPEAMAADAYFLLVDAVNSVGLNVNRVAHFVRNTTFNGVTGKIIIAGGKIKRTVVLREVKDSKFRPIAIFEP